MAVLKVIKYGHQTLRNVAEPYSQDEVDAEFIKDMLDTMYAEDGVGLAAPQVNVSKRLIVCSDRQNEYVFFNPKIIAHSESMQAEYEGCLSLPGLHATVERYDKVIVTGKDANWQDIEVTARSLLAVVFQHEIDHLNGILYIDRADLGTLSWTDAVSVDQALREQPATVEMVQQVYERQYHSHSRTLVFENNVS